MYTVLANNYQTEEEDDSDYVVVFNNIYKSCLNDCVLTKEINKIDNLSFSFSFDNCNFNFSELFTRIKVVKDCDNEVVFKGRVLSKSLSMNSDGILTTTIVCESCLAYLTDTIQPYQKERQWYTDNDLNGLENYLTFLLNNHNNQVEEYKKIYLGNVNVSTHESNNDVYKGTNYENTLNIIQKKLVDVFGGEINLRYENNLTYLDYLEPSTIRSSDTIELSNNLINQNQSFNVTNIITRLIPLGSKTKDSDGNETEERTTIESVNNGKLYIEDGTYLSKFGRIYKTVVWDDVTEPNNLKTKAIDFLENNNNTVLSHSLKALNLNLLNNNLDEFITLGHSYRVINDILDIDEYLRVVKVKYNLLEPYKTEFDLGDTKKSIFDEFTKINNNMSNIENNLYQKINKLDIKNNFLNNYNEQNTTEIMQDNNIIKFDVENTKKLVTDLQTSTQIIKNILSMDENGSTMLFSKLNSKIKNIENNVVSQNEILKYIRFEDGNILLGEKNNPLTLSIENDKICFRYNGINVSYWDMTTSFFHVGNISVEAYEQARFGNFAFLPQSDGSMSFEKVR